MSEKYTVHDYTVEQILNFIKSDEIAIPEIQRLFVRVALRRHPIFFFKTLQNRNTTDESTRKN